MTPATPITTVLFDLDGTLVDSAADLQGALNRLLVSEGRAEVAVDAVKLMIGDGVKKLVERGFEATGGIPPDEAVEALMGGFIKDYEANSTVLTRPFPGAKRALKTLNEAGARMALCTNKPHGAALEILGEFGLDGYFEEIVGGDSLGGIKKPDPRFLLETLKRLGVDPANAVMVGDNQNDVDAARGAGLRVIVLGHGYTRTPPADLGADALIEHFDQLAEAITGLS